MRIGEATALQRQDIDFAKNYIIVRRVDMSPELVSELKRLRTERKKKALSEGKVFDAEGWVFPSQDGTPIYDTNFLRRVFQDLAQVRQRTPHDLRRTWAPIKQPHLFRKHGNYQPKAV